MDQLVPQGQEENFAGSKTDFSRDLIEINNQFKNFNILDGEEKKDRKYIQEHIIPFGVKFLDDALGGLLPRDICLIGARTGQGKTEVATIIAAQNAASGKNVYFFALEADEHEIQRRILYKELARYYFEEYTGGIEAGVYISYRRWLLGDLDDIFIKFEDKIKNDIKEKYKNLNVFYRKNNFTVEDLDRLITSVKEKADLIIIDHLHYFDFNDKESENEATSKIVKRIREISLENKIPIILIAHVRKSMGKEKTILPDIDDFHGTSNITKIATKAIMIAPSYDQPERNCYVTLFQVAKSRIEGGLKKYVGRCIFDHNRNTYRPNYAIGSIENNEFKTIDKGKEPRWYNVLNVNQPRSSESKEFFKTKLNIPNYAAPIVENFSALKKE